MRTLRACKTAHQRFYENAARMPTQSGIGINIGIELNKVGIGDTGIDADYVAPFKFFNKETK